MRVKKADGWDDADRIMARYAPVTPDAPPGRLAGRRWSSPSRRCSGRSGSEFPREAFTRSGSSIFTLGFAFARDLPETTLSFVAATVGLVLVALLIAFLPSIYAQFSRREVLVGQLDTRAGTPPDPAVLLERAVRIDWLEELDDLWIAWDQWFVELEETHTSNVALPFFRSQHPGALVAHRGGVRPRHRLAPGVGARPAPHLQGGAVHPLRLPRPAPHRRCLRHPARPRSRTRPTRSP